MNLDLNLYWHRIQNDEESALEEVYKLTFKSLVIYASEITGGRQIAEEIVQDVFLKIWQSRSELSITGSFRAYLVQSVHNHALNGLRHQKTEKESVNLLGDEKIWRFISDSYDLKDSILDRIFSEETEVLIEQVIKELPDQCGKVFHMSRYENLSNEEIALRLALSENTVKTHIYRALQKIAFALKKEK
jgi:RNA polymerase sigma-70 factor, ECF subfamily